MEGLGRRYYQAAIKKLDKLVPWATNAEMSTFDIVMFMIRNIRPILSVVFGRSEGDRPLPLSGGEYVLHAATRLLKKAGIFYGNDDALFLLAEMNFVSVSFWILLLHNCTKTSFVFSFQYRKYKHPRDYTAAFVYYRELAARGNATAHHMLGFMYATGIGHVVQRSQALAVLHHTFAAQGDDTAAQSTLGYWHLQGIGVDQECPNAAYHYRRVAEKGRFCINWQT